MAADLNLKCGTVAAIAVVLGFCDGCLNGMVIQPRHSGSLDLLGAVAALFVAVAMVAAFVIWLKQPWMRVAVRVIGSWSPRQVYFSLAGRFIPDGYDPRSERRDEKASVAERPNQKDSEEQPSYISARLSVVA